ncbi:hypothetical protein A2W54_03685 [Candidatus Giovannonibacteria bacterium RIFCSPHIGHO2_02_43_13]|uniref:Beta-glucosidase n=1 Tax=Candidatus Giovannonibacteria bacterium RIFCSPHIGHO2_02_43_13 TaxID=1798330 RepID=A0A1F5WR92_9BACT|nr:MAG: Beta-glucosidase A [Parcubacteria group bacterium GW2011_GWA2_44_13]OGF74622.1 MAG: hypothetical protein A3E06_02785 [Candidatus Giovannonibacteria bacterium RIFCSPHIGHO2_12_FULL_44_42]OGF78179.1 MAG: hypothetical protein A2W54_03685 [Candidatus Giovannonibacteria bacterium RIFCSPHIGHO2_02_43_13]OGF89049.1 MAG: hypothetical protein A3I94_01855 [Candidatus Giovannonibacteria bacterium RIFCSPLOWO2_02_FULL_43_54]OGF96910.1 MAG: hypothetical protein A3H08_02870 [Candidatus Giovannonibacteri
MVKLEFPKGFFWGAATSAHQVEGNNHNDWTEWEKENANRLAGEASRNNLPKHILDFYPDPLKPENYISGRACDHYNRFREDFDIAKSLNHNVHRFSIEWSRVEPEEGKWDEKEIEHYREVIRALREREIEPFVTLWHWTLPIWVAKQGGWENKKTIEDFARYVNKLVRSEGFVDVKFWITLNEPDDIYSIFSYFKGKYPPGKRSILKTAKVLKNLVAGHKTAYKAIHNSNPAAMVGFANNTIYFESRGLIAGIFKILANAFWNFWFLKKTLNHADFIGCNYYHHNVLRGLRYNQNKNEMITDMGWEIYPEGIYHVLKDLKKHNKPVYITENGIADSRDIHREKFIKEHLKWAHKAISEGVDVRGYFYWSLLDNFEWSEGFWPRFGLVEVDYKTMERRIRQSAYAYAKIAKENSLEV